MTRTMLAAAGGFAMLATLAPAGVADEVPPPWTLAEFLTVHPEASIELFSQIDANGDGLIDTEELAAAVEAGLISEPDG